MTLILSTKKSKKYNSGKFMAGKSFQQYCMVLLFRIIWDRTLGLDIVQWGSLLAFLCLL